MYLLDSLGYARWSQRLLSVVLAFSLGVVLLVVLPAPKAAAAPCDAPVVNEIACENTKTGNPSSEWQISGSGSSSIQGFATDISVNRGSTIGFKVKTASTSYRLDIYRMGYYSGTGARRSQRSTPRPSTTQPACQTQASTGLIDCGNWTQTASWAVPSTAVSGIYFAKLVAGLGREPHRLRRSQRRQHVGHVLPDLRHHLAGLQRLRRQQPVRGQPGRPRLQGQLQPAVRHQRRDPRGLRLEAEYPMVRFLEANGYDVSYTTGVDTERRGNLITNHKTFLSVGHDEYWSGGQRANVEAARAAGVNLAFFSGNEVFWKTRWENSIAGGSTSYRTLVTLQGDPRQRQDRSADTAWTGTWRDPRFSPPGDGGDRRTA